MSVERECPKFKKSVEYEYRSFFEYVAKVYDVGLKILMMGRETQIRKTLIKTAVHLLNKPETKNLTVLDLCTGTGALALMFKKMYPASMVYGIDVSKGMLDIAKEKAEKQKLSIVFKKCDVQTLPFQNESFDIIMSSLCMHELPLQTRNHVLQELRRVLKNEGILAVFDYGYQRNAHQKTLYKLLMLVEEESAREFLSKPFSKDLVSNSFRVVKHVSIFHGYLEYNFAKKEM